MLAEGRETFGVTPLDAEPSEVLTMPEDSLYPFLLALSMLRGVLRAAHRHLGARDRRRRRR